jgi:hypothetical protein
VAVLPLAQKSRKHGIQNKPAEELFSTEGMISGVIVQLCSARHFRVQSRQVCLYARIIDAQKLCRAGHHVNIEMLSLSPFPVHELEYRIFRIRVLEDDAGDLEQNSAKVWRTAFGYVPGLGVKRAGLVWWRVDAGKGHTSIGFGHPNP